MRDLLTEISIPIWIQLLTPIFFLFFVGVVFWVYRGDAKGAYEKIEKLPCCKD